MNTRQTYASELVHFGRIWRQAWKQSLVRESQFRAQAYSTLVVGVAQFGVALIPVLLIFSYASSINGWTSTQVYGVLGMYQIIQGLLNAFVAPNLVKMSQYISKGDLDTLLLLPASTQLLTTLRWMQPAELGTSGTGLLLVVISASSNSVSSFGDCLAAGAWIAIGLILLICLWANLSYMSYWFQSAKPISDLVSSLMAPGQYPVGFFPIGVRIVMLLVVPIGMATSLPIEALSGNGHDFQLAGGLALLIVAIAATRMHWIVALRQYASASS